MKCKNKVFKVAGVRQAITPYSMEGTQLRIIVTNDKLGKTITVHDETTGFSFPADVIADYLQ